MGQQINVNIRIDSDIKKQADLLFNDFGLNFTTAINAFIRQALRERAIPFQIRAVEPTRKMLLAEGSELMTSIQEDSARNGTDKITMDEIDAEIDAQRRTGSFTILQKGVVLF
jgi:addiction module RelB/DinJ family antitoxin